MELFLVSFFYPSTLLGTRYLLLSEYLVLLLALLHEVLMYLIFISYSFSFYLIFPASPNRLFFLISPIGNCGVWAQYKRQGTNVSFADRWRKTV